MKNTPLHLAVKSLQLDIIKLLVFDYQASPTIQNAQGKTALDLAQTLMPPKGNKASPETLREHVIGLLTKQHSSTKLPSGNTELKKARELEKLKRV